MLLSVCLAISTFAGYSQMVKPFTVNSAGGTATTGGIVIDWSFAEMMMINTASGGNLIVTAGLLQPIDPNVGSPELTEDIYQLRAYPNPVADQLFLESQLPEAAELTCQLLDITGKQVECRKVQAQAGTQIEGFSLFDYPSGDYLLRVIIQTDSPARSGSKTFKIQKVL